MNIWDLPESEMLAELNRLLKTGKTNSADWRKEAKEDFNFAAGHQWDYDDLEKLRTDKRPVVTFNRCNVIISAILGMEANQRQEIKFNPRTNTTVGLAEALNDTALWAREYGDIPDEEAQVFEDMLTCGMGWSENRMDYQRDLDGQIRQDQVNPLEMYWDPSARKRNLSDRRWNAHEKRMLPADIEAQFEKEDKTNPSSEGGAEDEDKSLYQVTPQESYNTQTGNTYADTDEEQKGIPVCHFQWYENVPVWRVQNPQTGQIQELDEDQYDELKKNPLLKDIPALKQKKRCYYYAFFTKDEIKEKGELGVQGGFSFNCVTGKRDHVNKSWFGIIRLIKDPQRWANKFFSTFIDILDSNAKGGIMVETGAVEDARDMEDKWARSDSIIWMKPGSIGAGKVMPKPTVQFPQAVDRLLQFAIQSIHDVSGVNLELLGAVDRAEIGVVVDSRKKSAYTILAPFFDSLRNFRQQNGVLLMECIKKFIPPQRIMEVLKDEFKQQGQQIIGAMKNIDLRRLDVIISESPQSDNNRYSTWMFMQQLLPQLIQLQMPVPPSVLEYSPLPSAIIEEWKGMIKAGQPEKEMMKKMGQMMQQIEAQKEQFAAMLKQAQAHKTEAEAQKVEQEIGQKAVLGPAVQMK